jgi:hypothetical protein
MLAHRRTRSEQPPGPVGIDWVNPVTRSLVLADNALVGFNEVDGQRPASQATRRHVSGGGVAYSNEESTTLWHNYDGNVIGAAGSSSTIFLFAQPGVANTALLAYSASAGATGIELWADASLVPTVYSSAGSWSNAALGATALSIRTATPVVLSHDNATGDFTGYFPWGVQTAVGASGITGRDSLMLGGYIGSGGPTGTNDAWTSLVLIWGRVLSPIEAQSILRNPWQVFNPEVVFFPVVVGQPQLLSPTGSTTDGWLSYPSGALYTCVDETVPDEADYTYTVTPGAYEEFTFDNAGAVSAAGGYVRYRLLAGSGSVTVELRQGATVLETGGPHTLTGSLQAFAQPITASTTDSNDLRVRFTGNS